MIDEIIKIDNEYIDVLPSVIKQEYLRVFELIEEQENYGAMMQLKDLAETIIKMYASIGLSEIYNKPSKNDQEISLLFEVTDKTLSLGDWAAVIHCLSQLEINDNLVSICQGIQDLTDPNGYISLVEWRNKCLGHGALGFLSDREYLSSFVRVYSGIADFIINHCDSISSIHINENKPEKTVTAQYTDDVAWTLFPFVTIDDDKIFFFDSFFESKRRMETLNYHYGIRKSHRKGAAYNAISNIHKSYKKSHDSNLLNSAESYEKDIFSFEIEEIIKSNSYVKDAVKATYFETWLNEQLDKYEKGVFWLQLPAACGKTVITQQLEKRAGAKINLSNASAKALYLNDSYNSNIELILQELEILFTHKNGRLLFKGANKPVFNRQNPNVKEEMACYINTMCRLLGEQHIIVTKKTVLIIDGLDQLSDTGFLNYIPDENQLEQNIYILLTSRTIEELLPETKLLLNKLHITETFAPAFNESISTTMLSYVKKVRPDFDDAVCQQCLSISKENFGYLHFLVNNWNILNDTLTVTSNPEELLYAFLEYIYGIYGNKYCTKLLLTIYILANIKSPISLKALSQVLGEEYVSFELIGILQDIHDLIDTKHLYKETAYEISNFILRDALIKVLDEKPFFDYEKKLSGILSDQIEDIFGDIENHELKFSMSEYRLIKTLFACEFDSFIRWLNYCFSSSSIIYITLLVYKTFESDLEKLSADIYFLFEKLRDFCRIQVLMLEEGLKEEDAIETDQYKMLFTIFASERTWEQWYYEKSREGDLYDLKDETSMINTFYDSLVLTKNNLSDELYDLDLLKILFNNSIGRILQKIQFVYKQMGLPDLVIKYTNLIIQLMQESSSDAFIPDYAMEYRTLSDAYESKGDLSHAKQYEALALKDEEKNKMLGEDVAHYLDARQKIDSFSKAINRLSSERNDELFRQIEQIENELYSSIEAKIAEKKRPETAEYLDCIYMDNELAELAHRWGEKEKNIYWYERLSKLIEAMDQESRYLFYTEITLKMITYAANLVEWEMISEAENILKTYLEDLHIIDDDIFRQAVSGDEYSYAKNSLSIAFYVVNSVLHPERLSDIADARRNLTSFDLNQCDKIISHAQENSDTNMRVDRSFFSYIKESDQYICKKNAFSKKGKSQNGKVVYKFNQQKCRGCEHYDCPARRSHYSLEY